MMIILLCIREVFSFMEEKVDNSIESYGRVSEHFTAEEASGGNA